MKVAGLTWWRGNYGSILQAYALGRYIDSITEKEKLKENDADVWIEDDVWIGCNVTILKGVRIGRGSVIGAGSVITKDVPPYTIHVGSHMPYERKRFSDEKIIIHERMMKENMGGANEDIKG